ncbi:MAG: radical SAM protein [Clostridia bacterium]|nr:radical SAM protein [Clostridia bacterium]
MEQTVRTTPSGEPLWSSFIHAKGAALGLPIAGNFELTSNCNFNCKMCYIHGDNHKEALSTEDWINLGKTARDAGMVFLLLTGGEPFLRKDFKEIYAALIEMGLLISINTNGSLIDDDMFAFLVKHPPLRMNISLYGCNDTVYQELCGKPVSDVVKHNIRRLHNAGIGVKINASVTPYNASEIEEIYAFGKETGVHVQATTYMFPPVRICSEQYGCSQARFTAEEAAAYMLKCREQYMTAEQLSNSSGLSVDEDSDCVAEEGEHMRCRAGRTAFWVTWDGRMLPCGMFPYEGYKIADMGFKAAWDAVRAFTETIRMPKECTGCAHKNRCSACAASVIAETGSASVRPDYICRMTEILNKLTTEKYPKQEDDQNADQ